MSRATKDALVADRIAHKTGKCCHFTGVQHDTCEVGVRYADIREVARVWDVCLAASSAACPHHQTMTREDALREIAEEDALFARVDVCRAAIVAKHGDERGVRSSMPCPTSCGGTLRYSIAGSNGHIHAACSSERCVSWME